MAPVTIDVFNSAKPTVIAMLVCPDAAKANSATIASAGIPVISLGAVIHCNNAAASVRMA